MYNVLCWFIILFRLLSIIATLYSKFQTVITPQPSKIGHMFMWNFFITKTYEITSCSNVHKS